MNRQKQLQMLRSLMPNTNPGPTMAYVIGQVQPGQDVAIGDSSYFVGAAKNLIRTSEKKSKTRKHREEVAQRKMLGRGL